MASTRKTVSPKGLSDDRKQDKRQRIMQAAESLFASRRFHEITMDDVAVAAGVAKGTLYGYFQDKDDLVFQTCTSGFDELCELIAGKIPLDAPFENQLSEACRYITGFFDRRNRLMQMMQAEEGRMSYCRGDMHDRWTKKRTLLVEALARIFDKGVQARQVRTDVSPDVLANLFLGMLRARARGFADAPPQMRRHELIVDLFCRGIYAPGPAPASELSV